MKTVNLFFACDDNYVPFLAVTLTSIQENCDPDRKYDVRVLHTGLKQENRDRLMTRFSKPNFSLCFWNIGRMLEKYADRLYTRDYYSKSTYYRLFIPELFPQLEKALYLDCDIVVTGDISKLYDQDMGDNLVAAVPDSMVTAIEPFARYVQNRLRVKPERYFNAGVLMMNLAEMRNMQFTEVFLKLLERVTFRVAQDQDYLNVICKDRACYLGREWNTMPGAAFCEDPKLIHFNLDCKPWWRDDVPFSDVFWDYAQRSDFLPEIQEIRAGFTPERIEHSAEQTKNLIALGQRQSRQRTRNLYLNWKIRQVVNG